MAYGFPAKHKGPPIGLVTTVDLCYSVFAFVALV